MKLTPNQEAKQQLDLQKGEVFVDPIHPEHPNRRWTVSKLNPETVTFLCGGTVVIKRYWNVEIYLQQGIMVPLATHLKNQQTCKR